MMLQMMLFHSIDEYNVVLAAKRLATTQRQFEEIMR